jgi:hypothetical protein
MCCYVFNILHVLLLLLFVVVVYCYLFISFLRVCFEGL